MKPRFFTGAALFALMSACSSGNTNVKTAPTDLTSLGTVSSSEFYEVLRSDNDCADGLGCGAWKTGKASSSKFQALSGFSVDPANPNRQKAPNARTTYNADYSLGVIQTKKQGSYVQGQFYGNSGNIDLTFDPGNSTLRGKDGTTFEVDASVGGNTVSGKFKTHEMSGTGSLKGHIDKESVVGNFYGEDKNTAVAGYFIGVAQ